jgi:2-haloalkanoic acid dehalogenase type II
MPELKAATFDCYGTLVDWEGGLAGFLYDLARRCGEEAPPPGDELRARWEEIQFELLTEPYRHYREVLSHSLRKWSGERGHQWNETEGYALERSMQCWQPFADTIPALQAARRAGLKLAIVSNSDHSIIGHTLRQLPGVEFDEVVLSEDVRAYKPATGPFIKARDLLGLHASEIVHVAFGFKYDIATAQGLGFQTAWVNRRREPRPDGAEPDYEWTDLWPLADAAGAPRAIS